jgi:DNA polymerase III subunit beta
MRYAPSSAEYLRLARAADARPSIWLFSGNTAPVEVTVRNGEVGEARERLPTTSEDEFHISFNPGYLLDGVSAVDSEKVLFKLNEPLKPGLIVPKTNGEEPDFLYLITPMRDSSSS